MALEHILKMSKALGDETRLAIFRFLTTRKQATSVAEVAETFALHPNAARAHLARLVEAGLVSSFSGRDHTPGRPRRLYRAAPGGLAPVFEPAASQALAALLLELLSELPGVDGASVRAFGVRWGVAYASRWRREGTAETLDEEYLLDGLVRTLDSWGFVVERTAGTPIGVRVQRCAFGELGQRFPGLVCPLVEGVLSGMLSAVRPDLSIVQQPADPASGGGCCTLRLGSTRSSSSL